MDLLHLIENVTQLEP